jgi:hypothetical protein
MSPRLGLGVTKRRFAVTGVSVVLTAICLLLAGCGSGSGSPAKQRRAGVQIGAKIPTSLLAGLRPIGRGPRFQPAASGPVIGSCKPTLGRRAAAHIEVFGANRVVLLAAGIGTRAPRTFIDGRLTRAGCFGALVTIDPTGTVYFRPSAHLTLGDVFRSWGQVLSTDRIADFSGGMTRAYAGGVRWRGAPGAVPLRAGAEIVVEIGPYVPPHKHFAFTPDPQEGMR